MERFLIVSLHDVAPPFEKEIDLILEKLAAIGIQKASLLIVPDYHRHAPMDRAPGWSDRLQQWIQGGHEPVLHGFFHRVGEKSGASGNAKDYFFRNFYTAQESEFLDLNFEAAKDLVSRGLEMFCRCGMQSRGFIAPAWLINDDGMRALRELGL